MSEYTKERRIAASKKRVPDQDIREIKALLEKRRNIEFCMKQLSSMLKDLKRQHAELQMQSIAEDYGICRKIVNKINHGLIYKNV